MTSSIPFRPLGKTGVKIPSIGLGCMGMSECYGEADYVHSLQVLRRSIELGSYHWDTADLYGIGKNEELLSHILKDHRKDVFLATKFAIVRDENGIAKGVRGDAPYVRESCEKSLKRLGVDYIDLYYQHRVDPKTPIEETVAAMAELVKEGKVKYLGLSECSVDELRRAYKVHPIAALQMEYSPWALDIEQDGILETCRELCVTIVAYSPLGRGFLSGQIKSLDDLAENDFRRLLPRFQGENFAKNFEIVRRLEELGRKKGVTSSQLCLAWILAQVNGPTTITLTAEEINEIRSAINAVEVTGGRYPDSSLIKTILL
ncbi:7800_t:CDS:2 [Ambispora gerdemannii]|uniref:7800_t:CDS:1 n=1 Tax=Ambispora gerdemannii TaxID=144530 RepID=A0A9N9BEU7_9GLOM|nr:7800_t:CDS:2 [Ambispora gerdemannii]